jgi:predicted transcriptional regulator
MNEEQIFELKNKALAYLLKQEHKGAILEKIYKDLNLRPFPITAVRSYLDELCNVWFITRTSISGSKPIYRITENGRDFILKGGYLIPSSVKSIPDKGLVSEKKGKKILFISYANENYDKVKLIKKSLEKHPLFEPYVVADRRKPNNALVKLVREGIEASYCIIPILSPQSYKEQWINQEIGYAEGIGKPNIPIVGNSILNDLKGFVHKQNQCPYIYRSENGLSMRDENKSFMACFRLLISDLVKELNPAYSEKDKYQEIKEGNPEDEESQEQKLVDLHLEHSRDKRLAEFFSISSNQLCPVSGLWRSETDPPNEMYFKEKEILPVIRGKPVIWDLVEEM